MREPIIIEKVSNGYIVNFTGGIRAGQSSVANDPLVFQTMAKLLKHVKGHFADSEGTV